MFETNTLQPLCEVVSKIVYFYDGNDKQLLSALHYEVSFNMFEKEEPQLHVHVVSMRWPQIVIFSVKCNVRLFFFFLMSEILVVIVEVGKVTLFQARILAISTQVLTSQPTVDATPPVLGV